MRLPNGTRFVSATDGGALEGNDIVWRPGPLGPGSGGQYLVTLLPDSDLTAGEVVEAEAWVDVGSELNVTSTNVLPVRESPSPLLVEYTVSETSVGQLSELIYTLTLTNRGSDLLTNLKGKLLSPSGVGDFDIPPGLNCNGYCDRSSAYTWTLGDLAPGKSITTFYRTYSREVVPGKTLSSTIRVSADGIQPVLATQDVFIDPSPLFRLQLSSKTHPTSPGELLEYELTYGNVGEASTTDATLRLPIPKETAFVSASDDAQVVDGEAIWDLGAVGVGASGQVRLAVQVADSLTGGDLIKAEAVIDSGLSTETTNRSTHVVRIQENEELQVGYISSNSFVGNSAGVLYTITMANTGSTEISDLKARVLSPGLVNSYTKPQELNCNGSCSRSEIYSLNAGRLAPGESKTVFFRPSMLSDAVQGAISRSIFTMQGLGHRDSCCF